MTTHTLSKIRAGLDDEERYWRGSQNGERRLAIKKDTKNEAAEGTEATDPLANPTETRRPLPATRRHTLNPLHHPPLIDRSKRRARQPPPLPAPSQSTHEIARVLTSTAAK
ncbi:unnamed protein product [Bursaphelenchus okinawaensis]|uniref:Uncharacterized protein n=1 Tax=Bursaphelenchus okinawaensis TaxID=465554 RepID=A0A811KPB0_9BILA|nr:unnamed protein product [Bursaphelenchus okinawaensis]CAG9107225.1 unnamed protein product [Bursaphelenchus okinawaensis]